MGIDPATATLVATAVSAGVSAIGGEEQAQAQSQAASYQAQVAANNQIIANRNATYAQQVGDAQEQMKRKQTAQLIGQQRAAMAGNGINPDVGSGVDVQSSAKKMGELDALTIRSNAAKTAEGYRDQGMNYGAQASLDRMESDQALTAGNLNAFSSLLSGASSVSSKWQQYQMEGAMP